MPAKKVTVAQLREKYSRAVKRGVKKGQTQAQIIDGLVEGNGLTIKDDLKVKAALSALNQLRTVNRLKIKK